MPQFAEENQKSILFRNNGDKILATIYKYQNHPSIKTILQKYNFSFSFKTESLTDMEKKMKSLKKHK